MSSFSTPLEKIYRNFSLLTLAREENLYAFIGRTTPWSNSEFLPGFTPEEPGLDQKSLDSYLKTIIALKKISSSDISLAIKRYDWYSGRVYDMYDCTDPDLLFKHKFGGTHPFYVLTSEYNVYKCMNNNGGVVSTAQPSGQFNQAVTLEDGYTWKFMFHVDENDRAKFLTSTHIPVRHNTELLYSSAQKTAKDAAIAGQVERVDVVSGGSGYTGTSELVSSGDGSGFTGTVTTSNGVVTGVTVTNKGTDYTTMTVNATNTNSSYVAATFKPQLAPQGGHGFNVANELGAFYTIISIDLVGYQDTILPVNVYFRQCGLIQNIQDINSGYSNQTYYFGPEHPQYNDSSIRSTFPQKILKPKIGEILYVKNHAPIQRSLYQLERLKFVVETL